MGDSSDSIFGIVLLPQKKGGFKYQRVMPALQRVHGVQSPLWASPLLRLGMTSRLGTTVLGCSCRVQSWSKELE